MFLDCDTLVCLTFSFETFNDVVASMVADLNGALILSGENNLRKCQNASFSVFSGLPYSNSGFFFVKDNPLAYQLFDT